MAGLSFTLTPRPRQRRDGGRRDREHPAMGPGEDCGQRAGGGKGGEGRHTNLIEPSHVVKRHVSFPQTCHAYGFSSVLTPSPLSWGHSPSSPPPPGLPPSSFSVPRAGHRHRRGHSGRPGFWRPALQDEPRWLPPHQGPWGDERSPGQARLSMPCNGNGMLHIAECCHASTDRVATFFGSTKAHDATTASCVTCARSQGCTASVTALCRSSRTTLHVGRHIWTPLASPAGGPRPVTHASASSSATWTSQTAQSESFTHVATADLVDVNPFVISVHTPCPSARRSGAPTTPGECRVPGGSKRAKATAEATEATETSKDAQDAQAQTRRSSRRKRAAADDG